MSRNKIDLEQIKIGSDGNVGKDIERITQAIYELYKEASEQKDELARKFEMYGFTKESAVASWFETRLQSLIEKYFPREIRVHVYSCYIMPDGTISIHGIIDAYSVVYIFDADRYMISVIRYVKNARLSVYSPLAKSQ